MDVIVEYVFTPMFLRYGRSEFHDLGRHTLSGQSIDRNCNKSVSEHSFFSVTLSFINDTPLSLSQYEQRVLSACSITMPVFDGPSITTTYTSTTLGCFSMLKNQSAISEHESSTDFWISLSCFVNTCSGAYWIILSNPDLDGQMLQNLIKNYISSLLIPIAAD